VAGRGGRLDVWDYFERHQRECRDLGLAPSDTFPPQYAEMAGSSGTHGLILARYYMGDTALIEVKEVVEIIDGTHAHRVQYAYYFVVDGVEHYARERDPSHSPAVHGHGLHHVWEPADPIGFAQFVKNCWDRVSDLADTALDDPLAPEQ
jgi:hypothetical protein